jgi:hypothetical protein
MPIQCERCFDRSTLAEGGAIIESGPKGVTVIRKTPEQIWEKYRDVVRQLPRPTEEQTANFARYVAGAHSWYKHLPIHPGLPFCFYLDSDAGRNMLLMREGAVTFSDVTADARRFHYGVLPTDEYREQFGFWTYHAPYGRWMLWPCTNAVLDTRGHFTAGMLDPDKCRTWIEQVFHAIDQAAAQGRWGQGSGPREGSFVVKGAYDGVTFKEEPPVIRASEGEWIAVPIEALLASAVELTSLVHPNIIPEMCWAYDGNAGGRLQYPDFLGLALRCVPREVEQAMTMLNNLRGSAEYRETFKKFHGDRNAIRSQTDAKGSWETSVPYQKEREILDHFLRPALGRERARQLGAMGKAMDRFLLAVA